jgi:hypothetical protein
MEFPSNGMQLWLHRSYLWTVGTRAARDYACYRCIHYPSSIDQRPATGRGEGYASISRGQTYFLQNGTTIISNSAEISVGEMIPTHHRRYIKDQFFPAGTQELFASQRTRKVHKDLTVTAVICGVLLLFIVLIM